MWPPRSLRGGHTRLPFPSLPEGTTFYPEADELLTESTKRRKVAVSPPNLAVSGDSAYLVFSVLFFEEHLLERALPAEALVKILGTPIHFAERLLSHEYEDNPVRSPSRASDPHLNLMLLGWRGTRRVGAERLRGGRGGRAQHEERERRSARHRKVTGASQMVSGDLRRQT